MAAIAIVVAAIGTPAHAAPAFPPDQVARGAALAALGNCVVCHTAEGGAPYAGGKPIDAKVGTLYSTNITPDPDTGIGTWSLADFTRAMREGLRPDGTHLYPAFPYPFFTRMSEPDIADLYAFQMTREPVRFVPPDNRMPFPFNIRPLLAVWKGLFFDRPPVAFDDTQNAEWNRGNYLADAVAHCGACHSPMRGLGAEDRRRRFDGGNPEGWHAPALNASNPAPVPWTRDGVFAYLREGWDALHGAVRGPMQDVTLSARNAPDADLAAIAAYFVDRMGGATPEARARGERAIARAAQDPVVVPVAAGSDNEGRTLFVGACAPCHSSAPMQPFARGIDLALSSALRIPTPDNIAHVILDGIHPPAEEAGFLMPGFRGALTDEQIAAIVSYAAETYGNQRWPNVLARVRDARRQGERP